MHLHRITSHGRGTRRILMVLALLLALAPTMADGVAHRTPLAHAQCGWIHTDRSNGYVTVKMWNYLCGSTAYNHAEAIALVQGYPVCAYLYKNNTYDVGTCSDTSADVNSPNDSTCSGVSYYGYGFVNGTPAAQTDSLYCGPP